MIAKERKTRWPTFLHNFLQTSRSPIASYHFLRMSHLLPKSLDEVIDFSQPSLWLSVGSIVFNPLIWNIVARNEHRKRTLTKTLGSPYSACYLMAVCIFAAGIFRDSLFEKALRAQPQTIPESMELKIAAAALFIIGQILVITSTWALGVTGTYLGDYCGLLQDKMVTGFPFNVQTDPMYNGATMCFLATALWYRRPAGILITGVVYIVYQIALKYEGPFTSQIYADREAKRAQKSNTSKSTSTATASAASPSTPSYAAMTSRGKSNRTEL
ncbi:methylene-fatty-acyl-phospholipid synthase [Phaffia rhodozyma]|uniref:Phosphatidyl-N-methylethanolamine N-methyltransferase n=1 Tax=Phaffia rhodozyma TaxID=264483 RepID=A0A0F7SV36_PHARH|nr:methylene-fatty-acyl-phospholipid synthase [Phaffia rhodozyma]